MLNVLFYAFGCLNFHEQGTGSGGFGGSLLSVVGHFRYSCPRIGRTNALDMFFFLSFAFRISGTKWGWGRVAGVCLLSALALLVCMPARWEAERARLFLSPPLNIPFFRERGSGIGVAPYSRRRHFWHACQRIGSRACGALFILRSRRSTLMDSDRRGGEGRLCLSFRSDGAFGMHVS